MPERIDLRRPHPLFDVAAARRIEQAAAAGLPPYALMQRAGLALARLALALAPHARRMWIACGPGNNGGDGLEAAMHLTRWSVPLTVTWLGDRARVPADARAAFERAQAAGVTLADAPPADLSAQDLCIDALLGIGAARAPAGRMADWLHIMRASSAPLLAVDLPSGLNADTGVLLSVDAAHIPARAPRHTLTLLTVKPGLFTADGRDACGTVWFDDLGVAPDAVPGVTPAAILNGAPPATARLHASHKGSFGDVAVIGGMNDRARGIAMTGAALLAASAALHGGAGRVYVAPLSAKADGAGDAESVPMLDVNQPELMFRRWQALPLETLTVVCGCGGGLSDDGGGLHAALPDVLRRAPRLVLDADALNLIAVDAALAALLPERAGRGQHTVLTPHPLEAARLLAADARVVQGDRLAAARALVRRWRAVVALKGSGTVIAAPDETPRLNPTGNARLATAGTGDALAGLIGAYWAAPRQSAFAATCAAVYRHGQIADDWHDSETLIAGALARRLPCIHSQNYCE